MRNERQWTPLGGALVFLIVIATLSPAQVEGRQTRIVQGLVRDAETGERVSFAEITVPGTNLRAESNRDGLFTLVSAPAGAFELRVASLGYRASVTSVGADQRGRLTVEMRPNPLELEGVTLVADDYRVVKVTEGVSQVTIAPGDISLLPNVGEADIFRSLQLLPGVSGTNESSSGLYVRGGTPDQNLVLLDGMTVYHVDHFFGFFSAFNADAIKDVQLFKSAFPARYGGRVSSVVDMTGKTGDPDHVGATFGANLLSANATLQAPLGDKASLLVTGRRSYTDVVRTGLYSDIFGLFDDESIQTPQPEVGGRGGRFGGGRGFGNFSQAVTTPDFYFYDLNAKATYRPTDEDVLSLSVYQGRDNLDDSRVQTQDVLGQNFSRSFTTDVASLSNWGNRAMSGMWSRQWSPRVYTRALAAFSDYSSNYSRLTGIENRDVDSGDLLVSRSFGTVEGNEIHDLTLRIENEVLVGAHHRVELGGSLTRNKVRYDLTRDDTVSILGLSQTGTQMAVYAADTWNPERTLELSVGGRAVYYDVLESSYLEPRVSLVWSPRPGLSLKGAFGKHNQFVSRVVNENVTQGSRDFWLLADGDLINASSSEQYVVGVSYELEGYLFDVELFRKDLDGLSEFSLRFQRAADPDPFNLFFGGSGVAQGAEFLVQKKFGRLSGWVSYTLSNVEHTFPDLNGGRPFPALHDQQHELKGVGTFSAAGWTLSSSWTYGSGKPYTAPESEYALELLDGTSLGFIHVGEKNVLRLPAYHRLDISATRRFKLWGFRGDLGLSVFNAYDRDNVWYREFDLSQSPVLVTDVNYLGRVVNFTIRFRQ